MPVVEIFISTYSLEYTPVSSMHTHFRAKPDHSTCFPIRPRTSKRFPEIVTEFPLRAPIGFIDCRSCSMTLRWLTHLKQTLHHDWSEYGDGNDLAEARLIVQK